MFFKGLRLSSNKKLFFEFEDQLSSGSIRMIYKCLKWNDHFSNIAFQLKSHEKAKWYEEWDWRWSQMKMYVGIIWRVC